MPPEQTDALSRAILAAFPGAQVVVPDAARGYTFQPRFEGFHDHAQALWARGWAAFPQSRDGVTRKPLGLKSIGHFRTTMPTARERADMFDTLTRRGRMPNAAFVIPDGMLVLDVDVPDARADLIEEIAAEALGATPFVRRSTGSLKRGLILRTDSSLAGRPKSSHTLLTADCEVPRDEDGQPVAHAVELLMPGSVYTIAGAHWRSGQPFRWDLAPWAAGADAAPVVGHAQVEAFLDAVEARVAPLSRRRPGEGFNVRAAVAAAGAVSAATVDASGLVVPAGREIVLDVTYDGGKVIDGRERYILSRAYAYALANPGLAALDGGRHALAGALLAECRSMFQGLGSKYSHWDGSGSSVLADCRRKVESGHRKALRNPDERVRLGREENGRIRTTVRTAIAIERNGLCWVEAAAVSLRAIDVTEQDRKRRERALVMDPAARVAGQQAVSESVHALGRRFLADVREFLMDREAEFPVRVGRYPTGAGKTSTLVEILGRGVPGPILFLLPSYANIEEVLERHRAGRKAKPAAAAETATFKAAAAEAVADALRLGLNVQVMTGKEKGGCLMREHLAMCRAHHAPAQALCHKDVKELGDVKPKRVYCRHHPDNEDRPADVAACPVIEARRQLLNAHIVFAPTAFLTQTLPEGLKKHFAGLIVDERCLFELLRFDHFPARVLDEPRPEPTLDKEERAEGVDPQDILRDRDEIARLASKALAEKRDVAEAVLAYERRAGNRKIVRGADLLDAAIAVAARGQNVARAIRPNMRLEDLERLLTGPRADYLRQEHRFWRLVRERVEALQGDAQASALNAGVLLTRAAKGDRDVRIQALDAGIVPGTKEPTVRVSWIDAPTLDCVPTLLLDASADEALVAKAFRGREVVMTDVDAYLHMQVVACLDAPWGVTSFDPGEGAPDERKEQAARNVGMARRAVTNVAGIHGQGRVAAFAPRRTRVAMQKAFAEAGNVDHGHFGALKGLDFAKDHMAVVTLGRHEFPSWIYDALAAACTYDDDEPELPFDRFGNGLDAEDKPLSMPRKPRTYRLRDGRDMTVEVSEMPGAWGHRIQRQFREEELRQAAGRLRPVYRDAVGTWVAVSNVLPEDTVIDAVTSLPALSTLSGAGQVFEAIRRVGVADPELIRAQAPDALKHPEAALRRFGLLGADLSSPYAAGMDAYVVNVDGEERTVQVPSWHGEHAQDETVEAYDRNDRSVRGIRRVAEGGLKVPSQVKAPDKVDAILGTREERLAEERELRDAARTFVEPGLVDRTCEVTLAAFDPAAVDVSRAMVLQDQMGCDGPTAARLGGSAPRHPEEAITFPEDPVGGDGGDSAAAPAPTVRRPDESPRPAARAVPSAALPGGRLAALRYRQRPDA
ncbi:hypothetical protein [Methylorubrum thiocyanatum]|uniref:hypothetical protein n=1 Tax=Methylorubrum thiocyanatum TaxID=47958 RepID=UPI0035C86C88